MSDSINDIVLDTTAEPKVVDLSDFDEPSGGGAWPKGWYAAEVLEGYSTPKGTTFITEDGVSKDGASRNLRLCFKVSKGDQTRNIQENFNYRISDFTAERMAHIKEMRAEYKDVKGRWPDGDAQRSSLALVNFGALSKVVGGVKFNADGTVLAQQFVGRKLQVYLGIDENNYNKVKHVKPA